MLYLTDGFFQATDAQHFARPRGILVVAQPSSHEGTHSAHAHIMVDLKYCCTAQQNYL